MRIYKKNRKREWLIGFLAGIVLSVSACGTEDQNTDVDQPEGEQTQTVQVQEDKMEEEADIAAVSYENLPVVYSLDNSTRVMESKSGVFTGDWDNDGVEDMLTIETAEQEGSEIIQRLELALSGCPEAYVIENADCDFIDMQGGDFDGDGEAEILLLFDMRYAGANGCCSLQLLDKIGSEYVNVTGNFFTGFSYTMEVQTGENGGYRIINDQSKAEILLEKEIASESAIAEVTGWYALEILGGEEQDYIRLKQYIAGEDMTDHVGDMVTILALQNNELNVLYENVL